MNDLALSDKVEQLLAQMSATQAQMAAMQAELDQFKTPLQPQPQPVVTMLNNAVSVIEASEAKAAPNSTRRRMLRRLAGGMLAGIAVGTVAVAVPESAEAKIIGRTGRVGAVILGSGDSITGDLPGGTYYNYGLVALNGTGPSPFDLAASPYLFAANTAIYARSSGTGVYASGQRTGVSGSGSIGVYGSGDYGVQGSGYTGVVGSGIGDGSTGVEGSGSNSGVRGSGLGADSIGVIGKGTQTGVSGSGTIYGVYGFCTGTNSTGVVGSSGTYTGVTGKGDTGVFGDGTGSDSTGVLGIGTYTGVDGRSAKTAVSGLAGSVLTAGSLPANASVGVFANAGYPNLALNSFGDNTNYGLYVIAGTGGGATSRIAVAAVFNGPVYFYGAVNISGTLSKPAGSFKIDHPQDPANKYLYHSFVESPDMLNIYNGIARLDQQGCAEVEMPAYFEALNTDFRYGLTSIGRPSPNLHIAQKMQDRRFVIGGGLPGQEVSWMVTGIRQDAYAKAHPIQVEQDKAGEEKGRYLHPLEHGQPQDKSVDPLQREKGKNPVK
jgi:hypothetical protein